MPHPRSYGTFSRKIGRYAIEDKLISLEGAVRSGNRAADMVAAKLSSWPLPQDATMLFPTIAAFDEIAANLS